MLHKLRLSSIIFSLITFVFSLQMYGQTTVVNDQLNGSTVGEQVGGSFTSEGYKPGKGENHILYKLPQIVNGYVEFEVKGFNPNSVATDEDHAFIILYDGRGISEPVKYFNDFKYNFFRWNFHWRENKNAFKAVITCADPTSARINASKAVFSGGGTLRDWFSEPTGRGWSWNTSTWYKMRIEWNNKKFSASVNGTVVWSTSGPNDYAPIDFRIWLGSGPDKYNSDVNDQVFRNFKVVSYGGSVTPTNNLSLSPSSQNVGSSAGNTNLSVSSNVNWTAKSNASWLSVSPTSENNNATITASFGVNSSSSSRTATVTVSGGGITRTATITQSGSSSTSNSLAVTPASQSVSSSAGNTSFSIASNVSWSVSDNASWLNVSPSSGSNNSNLSVSVQQNTSSSARTATITTVGGGITRTVSVTQAGSSTNGGSNYITVPEIINVPNSSGEVTVDVQSNVSWKVSDNTGTNGWISKSPKTGTGNGQVKMTYKQNTGSASREGNLIFVGSGITKLVRVIQAGSSNNSNSLAVTPSNQNVNSNSGTTSFSIASNVSWSVSDNASWLNVSPSSGSNNGNLSVSVQQNTSSSARTATITTVGGGITRTVTVTQAGTSTNGGGNYITVPEILNLPNTYGKITVNVQSNVSWKVSDNTGTPGWLSKTPKTGTGNGQVILTYQSNSTGNSREGALIFVGGGLTKTIRIIQGDNGGSTNTGGDYLNVPETLNLSAKSGNLVIDIKSNISWVVSDNTGSPGWLSKTPKTGTGDGKVTLTYRENLTGKSRTGSLFFRNTNNDTIKTIKITQSANGAITKSNSSDMNELNAENVEIVEIPTEYALGNYPNPFNPTTTIQYSLPFAGHTELTVYNSLGQVVKTLVSEFKSEGTYSVHFNASELSSGIYFYTLRSGNFVKTSKMMLLE